MSTSVVVQRALFVSWGLFLLNLASQPRSGRVAMISPTAFSPVVTVAAIGILALVVTVQIAVHLKQHPTRIYALLAATALVIAPALFQDVRASNLQIIFASILFFWAAVLVPNEFVASVSLIFRCVVVVVLIALLVPALHNRSFIPGGGFGILALNVGERLSGPFAHPNQVGMVLAVAGLFELWRGKSTIGGLFLLLDTFLILQSGSRTALIALIAAIVCVRLHRPSLRAVLNLSILLTAVVPILFVSTIVVTGENSRLIPTSFASGRGLTWRASAAILSHHPYGAVPDLALPFSSDSRSLLASGNAHAHNLFVEIGSFPERSVRCYW